MKREMRQVSTMGAYDALAETLLSIGGVLHGLEAVVNGPSLYRERAVSLAALGESLVRDAQQQAGRLLEAIRQPERRKLAKGTEQPKAGDESANWDHGRDVATLPQPKKSTNRRGA